MGKRNPALSELRNENGGIQECGRICKGHMPEMRSEVRQLADQPEMLTKWRYFLRSLGNPELDFTVVIQEIGTFLLPVWQKMMAQEPMAGTWHSEKACWDTGEE